MVEIWKIWNSSFQFLDGWSKMISREQLLPVFKVII